MQQPLARVTMPVSGFVMPADSPAYLSRARTDLAVAGSLRDVSARALRELETSAASLCTRPSGGWDAHVRAGESLALADALLCRAALAYAAAVLRATGEAGTSAAALLLEQEAQGGPLPEEPVVRLGSLAERVEEGLCGA